VFMIIAASAGVVVTVLIAVNLHSGLACRESRTVLLHVPLEAAWEKVRDFGALQAAHGRGRPLLRVESSELQRGDGLTPGSVWRQRGRWGERPWWAEIEIIAVEPPRRLEVALVRDAFGTNAGLAHHRCILDLAADGPRATKLRFRLRARTRGARLTLARTFSRERLYARLLDLGLRSLKVDVDAAARAEAEAGAAAAVTRPGAAFPAGVRATGRAESATPAAPSRSRPVDHDQA